VTTGVGSERAALPIRDYRPDDLEAAYRLDQSCFEEGISYTRGQIRAFLAREGAIALVVDVEGPESRDGDLAAFAIGHVAGRKGHVVTIDISSMARRLGLGARVLAELLSRMARAGAREARLEVDVRNTSAIRFYEKMGFRETRKLPDYYGWGLDGVRMTRKLAGSQLRQ
jgi:ribosomal-protein-alanine N-acetyltransferase